MPASSSPEGEESHERDWDLLGVQQESPVKRIAMLVLKIGGGAAWVMAYRRAILHTRATGQSLLPEAAIAANLSWEAVYTLGGAVKWRELTWEDRVQTVLNAGWLSMDLAWVNEIHRKNGRWPNPAILGTALAYQLAFLSRYEPADAARRSALVQNLGFSAHGAFAPSNGDDRLARQFTIYRAIGTAVPTITSGFMRGVRPEYLLPGIGCVTLDVIHLVRQGQPDTRPTVRESGLAPAVLDRSRTAKSK